MRSVVTHPEADLELETAARYYEECSPGLGNDFLDEFETALGLVVATPERWRKIRGENGKLNFRRFPYAIVYGLRRDHIFIMAVMHLHRRPFYWRHRK